MTDWLVYGLAAIGAGTVAFAIADLWVAAKRARAWRVRLRKEFGGRTHA